MLGVTKLPAYSYKKTYYSKLGKPNLTLSYALDSQNAVAS